MRNLKTYCLASCLVVLTMLVNPVQSVAQDDAISDVEIRRIEYGGLYRLQESYAILYDNKTAAAKLKAFRVAFLDDRGQVIFETETQTHPIDANIALYTLPAPVEAFQSVELSVLSLHAGEITDFPTEIGGILALNEVTEMPAQDPSESSEVTDDSESGSQSEAISVPETTDVPESEAGIDSAAADEPTGSETSGGAAAEIASGSAINENINSELGGDASSSAEPSPDEMGGDAADQGELGSGSDSLADAGDATSPAATAITTVNGSPVSPDTNPDVSVPYWLMWVLGVLTLFGVLFTLFKWKPFAKAKARPDKAALKDLDDAGVLFPVDSPNKDFTDSPFKAGDLNLLGGEMLIGEHDVLQKAYRATGRIGYAQKGIPTENDYSFGTGFLITDRHVLTNRHVHRGYRHLLLNPDDPGGIEFMAEKGLDASDFVAFKTQTPILLPGLDIAIYELVRPVKNRKPLTFKPVPAASLDGRKIAVIGYPDTREDLEDLEDEVLAVLEEDPIFAVKRLSWGHIFRHSTDDDETYGVETRIRKSKYKKFTMAAICHNASTMGGNSGSPVLDFETGDWVGVHFRGYPAFKKAEAANLAMAIDQLSSVTDVTDRPKNLS